MVWDILVTTDDGQTVTAVPHSSGLNVHESCSKVQDCTDIAGQLEVGKENVQKEQMSFLTQKLSVLESIINKRRCLPQHVRTLVA